MLNLKEKEVVEILKNGGVGVLPTDTLYGLVGSAFSRKVVERIYKMKNRDKSKPFIVLISDISGLKKFDIKINKEQAKILKKFWPGKVSIILPCLNSKFQYLHRGTKSIAFRFPNNKKLLEILNKTGPLVAPSANKEEMKPAEDIVQAKKYFKQDVDFYLSGKKLKSKPSIVIKVGKKGEIEILRGIIKR